MAVIASHKRKSKLETGTVTVDGVIVGHVDNGRKRYRRKSDGRDFFYTATPAYVGGFVIGRGGLGTRFTSKRAAIRALVNHYRENGLKPLPHWYFVDEDGNLMTDGFGPIRQVATNPYPQV